MGRPKGSKNRKLTALGIDANSREWIGYRDHRLSAKGRGIPFRFTYEEWVSLWKTSGKFHLRGIYQGCYVMARFGDKGAYEVGNVVIIPTGENLADAHRGNQYRLGNKRSKAEREKTSKSLKKFYADPSNQRRHSEWTREGWKKRKRDRR